MRHVRNTIPMLQVRKQALSQPGSGNIPICTPAPRHCPCTPSRLLPSPPASFLEEISAFLILKSQNRALHISASVIKVSKINRLPPNSWPKPLHAPPECFLVKMLCFNFSSSLNPYDEHLRPCSVSGTEPISVNDLFVFHLLSSPFYRRGN